MSKLYFGLTWTTSRSRCMRSSRSRTPPTSASRICLSGLRNWKTSTTIRMKSNEAKLERVQMAWLEEYQDGQ